MPIRQVKLINIWQTLLARKLSLILLTPFDSFQILYEKLTVCCRIESDKTITSSEYNIYQNYFICYINSITQYFAFSKDSICYISVDNMKVYNSTF